MTIPLQNGIIYGPVNSRRLGRSLGINLLPADFKICTFNCLYCQYGWTKIHSKEISDNKVWPTMTEVVQETERVLKTLSPKPAYITFSGNGEPTLHPNFPELVREIKILRDKWSSLSKTAILSNSTTVDDQRICEAINSLDVKIMKLDCGNEDCFCNYNRPCCDIQYESIFSSLKLIDDLIIQSLFSDGPDGNSQIDDLNSWIEKIRDLSPNAVQIYTIQRKYPSEKISPLSYERLMNIRNRLDQLGVQARVYI